jgi:two-component system, OmpR family, response regulator
MKRNPLIFVVDDEPLILKLIEVAFKTSKVDIMTFGSGEDCLSDLTLNPDIIILDYIFTHPDQNLMNGLEVLHEIRKKLPEVPVIILSGQESGNEVLKLMRAGIEEYIIKEEDFIMKLKEAVFEVLQKR